VALAGLLVLAGCSSAVAPGGTGADTPTEDATPTTPITDGTSGTGSGTVNFYVSDERNAIGDFEHLNVTVERVSFGRIDDDGEGDDETVTPESGETPEPTETPDEEGEEGDGEEGDGEWITREVNATTVDLTELQGENATMLSRFDLPNGTYTQVRLHVTEVDGTLTSGEDVRVKLPSERLRLNERFVVGDGEEVDFVFDATVFEAGQSGKYVLKPVASESGTDVPIREVVREDGREGSLGARFLGPVRPGEAVTVRITSDGRPVTGAIVEVGDRTYETGSDGTVMFDVPADVEELEVGVEAGGAEAELKRTFGGESDEANEDRRDGSGDGTSEPNGTDTA
jgi:hypothetical protein